MSRRDASLVVLAVTLLTGATRSQAQSAAVFDLVAQVVTLTRELTGQTISADQLERVEGVIDRLPIACGPQLTKALEGLCERLPRQPDKAVAGRFGPVYDRLAGQPSIGLEAGARLLCIVGNHDLDDNRFDEALVRFAQASSQPRLAFYAFSRAFRCEAERQNYRAARKHLAAARGAARGTAQEKLRIAQMEALDAMFVGRFDAAGLAIARTRELADTMQADGAKLEAYDVHQLLLLEMDYAMFHQNLDRAVAKADELMRVSGNKPLTHDRAELVKHAARVRLGGQPELTRLREMFTPASGAHRDAIGALLIDHAMVSGADDLAASVAAELLAGHDLRELSAAALVAVGRVELQASTMPLPGSDRRREWADALHAKWERFLAEWRALEPEDEGVAFLQMSVRRNVLSLAIRLSHSIGVGQAAAHAATLYLEADALGSTARRLGVGPVNLETAIRELVPAGGGLLVYVPAPVGSIALWFTSSESHVELLPPEGLLRQRVFKLQQLAFAKERAASVDEVFAAAQSVATGLLTPELRRRLATSETLVVAGRELVHGLPIQLLPHDGPARWLGLAKPIVYLPSITVAQHLQRRPSTTASRIDARVIAATQLGEADRKRWHREPIDVAAAELAAAVAAVDPGCTEIVAPASAADLTDPRSGCELLAVFAHGIYDGQLACPAGVLLGPDPTSGTGAVFASSIKAPQLPRCLFLGVCGAARSALRLGEDGGTRLTGTFCLAGCDLVVSSDSDLRLDEAIDMLGGFTAALSAGESPAVALWQARCQVAAVTPHPGAWGGLQMEGLPTATIRLTPAIDRRAVWPWLGGSVLLCYLVWVCRRRWVAAPLR